MTIVLMTLCSLSLYHFLLQNYNCISFTMQLSVQMDA